MDERLSTERIEETAAECFEQPQSFLDQARQLDLLGSTDAALDVIYNHVDAKLLDGHFAEIDNRLATVQCDRYSLDLLLALLTITHAAKSHLPNRTSFYERAVKSARQRNLWEVGLFDGLE